MDTKRFKLILSLFPLSNLFRILHKAPMNSLYIPPKKSTFRWLQVLILLALGALVFADHEGYLAPLQKALDSAAFTYKFGKIEFTLYTILKSVFLGGLILWVTARLSRFFEHRIGHMTYVHPSSRALMQKAVSIVFYIMSALIIMDLLGLDLKTLTVLGGALGIGLGFGLQKIASNFVSGLILLIERSMKIGDMVEMEDGTLGLVRKNGARSTLIETFDGRAIMVPNENFITGKVINWTFSDNKSRIQIPVGVAYETDLRKAQNLILEAALENPSCLKDPPPRCFLKEFADSSVNFSLLFWVGDVTQELQMARSEVMFAIWEKFAANKIQIPYPQREIRWTSGPIPPVL
jgi:small-conductance mechanosensitive channel